jgi:hypothetical protein
MYGPPEQVLVEHEWYDSPRTGIAIVNGQPHRFRSQWDEAEDENHCQCPGVTSRQMMVVGWSCASAHPETAARAKPSSKRQTMPRGRERFISSYPGCQ